jgi:hypothetical protein
MLFWSATSASSIIIIYLQGSQMTYNLQPNNSHQNTFLLLKIVLALLQLPAHNDDDDDNNSSNYYNHG